MLPKLLLLTFCYLLTANTFAQFNPKLTYGEVKDVEGNTYKTIQIGTQTWMAENLRTTKFNDSSLIPLVTDYAQWAKNDMDNLTLPMMCWYNNDKATSTANKFGALYNWFAINPSTNGNKNVCPTGWHVPTDEEWNALIANLDPSYDPMAEGIQSSTAGGKMKSTGTQYWLTPNTGAINSSGWSGLPGSHRFSNGEFKIVFSHFGRWWSSAGSEYDHGRAWGRYLFYGSGDVDRAAFLTDQGLSVRCLRD